MDGENFNSILFGRYDHAKALKDAREGEKIIAQTVRKRGNETQVFKVGQTVQASGQGGYVEGTKIEITEVMEDFGYYRYFGGGMWHRTKDLKVL